MPEAEVLSALERAVDANWERQVAWLQSLVRFPSRRGQEGPCQDWIAREFSARGWSVDRYTLADVAMDHLPGFSPVMDTDYAQAVQVVATIRAPQKLGTQPRHAGPCRCRARGSARDVDASALRSGDPRWLDERARRRRHEAGRLRHGLRARCAEERRLRAGRGCDHADGDGGGVHRQRRALDARARLSRRGMPDRGAHFRHDHARPCRRDVVPPPRARRSRACGDGGYRHERDPLRLCADPGLADAHRGMERAGAVASAIRRGREPDQVQSRRDPRRRLGQLNAGVVRGGLPDRAAARRGSRRGAEARAGLRRRRRRGAMRSSPTIRRR